MSKKRTWDESWDLSSIPQAEFRREINRRSAAGRKGKSEQMRELAKRRWAEKKPDKKS